jgi:hypothetical protein
MKKVVEKYKALFLLLLIPLILLLNRYVTIFDEIALYIGLTMLSLYILINFFRNK